MNWLNWSLAKARMFEADSDAGGSPAATLESTGAEAGSDGGVTDTGAGEGGGEGEKKTPDYLTSIPKEFRDHKAFTEHEDLSSFLKKSLENSDKLDGFDPEKVLNIPGEDASEEVREAFYQQLGKPETVEGYELDDPGFPEGLERDTELEGLLKKWAHESNLPADGLKSLVNKYNAHYSEVFKALQVADAADLQAKTEALKAEKKEDYNEFVLKAQRAATQLGGEELITLLKDSGLETHPTLLKAFGKLGSIISEDSALGGGTGSGGKKEGPKGFDGKPRMTYDSDEQNE